MTVEHNDIERLNIGSRFGPLAPQMIPSGSGKKVVVIIVLSP